MTVEVDSKYAEREGIAEVKSCWVDAFYTISAEVSLYGLPCYPVPARLWSSININGKWKIHEETGRGLVPEEGRWRTWECFHSDFKLNK